MPRSICKICTTIPSATTPGAGLVCIRPSHGSPWSVKVLTPDPETCLQQHTDGMIEFDQPSGRQKHQLHRLTIVNRLRQVAQNLWIIFRALATLQSSRQTLVICYGLINLPAAYIFAKLHRAALVISLHNVTELPHIRSSHVLRFLVGKCDEVWVVSHELEREVPKIIARPTFYRPTGFDPAGFQNRYNPVRFESKTIVSVGVFKWKKAYPDLFKAMALLKKRGMHCRLRLIGDGPLKHDFQAAVEELGLQRNVDFLGTLPHADIEREFNNASLFVLPSVAEGRPKVVPEALATGLPCVVTSACNCDDLVTGSGLVVPPAEPDHLADAIGHLLTDHNAWNKASSNAEERVEDFTWAEVAKLEQEHITQLHQGFHFLGKGNQ